MIIVTDRGAPPRAPNFFNIKVPICDFLASMVKVKPATVGKLGIFL
jgi:hypothetical protein